MGKKDLEEKAKKQEYKLQMKNYLKEKLKKLKWDLSILKIERSKQPDQMGLNQESPVFQEQFEGDSSSSKALEKLRKTWSFFSFYF